MIIGISGKKQAGKDTTCRHIQTLLPDAKRIGFADYFKDFLIEEFQIDPHNVYGTDADKEEEYRPGLTYRQMMQRLGEFLKTLDPVVHLRAGLRRAAECDAAIFADVRFPEEVVAIQQAGGKVIRLMRSPCFSDLHRSETALDGYTGFDAVIAGWYSIEQVNDCVMRWLRQWGMVK